MEIQSPFSQNRVEVDMGALQMAINVLQRAGKAEVADALMASATKPVFGWQTQVNEWMNVCFTPDIVADKSERLHRFYEESTELVQAGGMPKQYCLDMVEYTYGREVGELTQEVGGVGVTLTALCNAYQVGMTNSWATELARCWTKVDKIREKQKLKPKSGPLPGVYQ